MTEYIYIASPMKLPQGSFGLNPVSSEQPHVFEREIDFVHLHFTNNDDSEQKQKFTYSPHFSFAYQVAVASNYLPCKHQLTGTVQEEKCVTLLYTYLEQALEMSGIVEYFTSLSGKEHIDLSNRKKVRWSDIKTPYDIVLAPREFWEISL